MTQPTAPLTDRLKTTALAIQAAGGTKTYTRGWGEKVLMGLFTQCGCELLRTGFVDGGVASTTYDSGLGWGFVVELDQASGTTTTTLIGSLEELEDASEAIEEPQSPAPTPAPVQEHPTYNHTDTWKEMSRMYRGLLGSATKLLGKAHGAYINQSYHQLVLATWGDEGITSSTQMTPMQLNEAVRVLERHDHPGDRLAHIESTLKTITTGANDDAQRSAA